MNAVIRKANMDDFEALWTMHSHQIIDKIERISSRVTLLSPVDEQEGLKKRIVDGRFFVAEYDNKIVGQMVIDFPRQIKYVSLDDEQIEVSDAFLHQDYILKDFRGTDVSSRILEAIEAEAGKNSDIEYLYVAVEGVEPPEWWEETGYTKIGKECRSCPLWEIGCRDIPMYRKENK